jgi:hypothetical protein
MRSAVIATLLLFSSVLAAENLYKWDTGFESGNHVSITSSSAK